MNRNIVDAIGTLITQRGTLNQKFASYDDFVYYVKNLFANGFGLSTFAQRECFRKTFSFVSSSAEIPDLMLSGGDAVEIKTVRLKSGEYDPAKCSSIEFNTVYPRQKLFFDDPLVTTDCRRAERWAEKDIIYIVAALKRRMLIHLCMVYGVDYCASEKFYSGTDYALKSLISRIPAARFPYSRELARIVRVDPMRASFLKIYGMWHVENPWSFFGDVYRSNPRSKFSFMCIINTEKFSRIENAGKLLSWAKILPDLTVEKIQIRNPDKPEQLRDAFLIRYEI